MIRKKEKRNCTYRVKLLPNVKRTHVLNSDRRLAKATIDENKLTSLVRYERGCNARAVVRPHTTTFDSIRLQKALSKRLCRLSVPSTASNFNRTDNCGSSKLVKIDYSKSMIELTISLYRSFDHLNNVISLPADFILF